MNNLAALLMRQGKLPQAERMLTQVLESREAKYGRNHPKVLGTKNSLAAVFKQEVKLEQSSQLYEDVIAGYESMDIPDKNRLELARYNLACVLHDQASSKPPSRALAGPRGSRSTAHIGQAP